MAETIAATAALNKPNLLDQVRNVIRRKHYIVRTEQAYLDWRLKPLATH